MLKVLYNITLIPRYTYFHLTSPPLFFFERPRAFWFQKKMLWNAPLYVIKINGQKLNSRSSAILLNSTHLYFDSDLRDIHWHCSCASFLCKHLSVLQGKLQTNNVNLSTCYLFVILLLTFPSCELNTSKTKSGTHIFFIWK